MSDIEERVKKIVVEHLGVEEAKIQSDSKFIDDLGADSLDTVELVMAFEEEFGCEIPDDAAEKIVTLKDAVSYLTDNSYYLRKKYQLRRVVVTGLGTINPLGNTVDSSWSSLIKSNSGISKISKFDVDSYPCKIAGSIEDIYINDEIVSQRDQRKIDRFIILGLIAADEAIKDSGFISDNEAANRSGVMVGSGIGGLDTIYKNSSILDNQGIRKISPFLFHLH